MLIRGGETGGAALGYCRERLLEAAFTPQRSRIVKKRIFDDYCCFLSTFCEAERNDPKNQHNSLKSIGYMCKSDIWFWHVSNASFIFHWFLLVNIIFWRNTKASKLFQLSINVGIMCKMNKSHLWYVWCKSNFVLFFLVTCCCFWFKRGSILH